MAGTYGSVVKARKRLEEKKVQREKNFKLQRDYTGTVPYYSVPMLLLVSAGSFLVGTVFFVCKWFESLNYLLKHGLFKGRAMGLIWCVILVSSAVSIFIGLGIVEWFMWFVRIAFFTYIFVQLRKCRIWTLDIKKKLRNRFAILCVVWGIEFLFLLLFIGKWRLCEVGSFLDLLPILTVVGFLLAEFGMMQTTINVAIRASIAEEENLCMESWVVWNRFIVVVIWCAAVVSAFLFIWDVSETVYYAFGRFDGFQAWRFFEGYYPHAGWQLFLWCYPIALIALSECLRRLSIIKKGISRTGRVLSALFPNVTTK